MTLHSLTISSSNPDSKEKLKVSLRASFKERQWKKSPFTPTGLRHSLRNAASLHCCCYLNLASVCLCRPNTPQGSFSLS